jgi:hypothetical protein
MLRAMVKAGKMQSRRSGWPVFAFCLDVVSQAWLQDSKRFPAKGVANIKKTKKLLTTEGAKVAKKSKSLFPDHPESRRLPALGNPN